MVIMVIVIRGEIYFGCHVILQRWKFNANMEASCRNIISYDISGSGASLTSIPAGQLTGALPAIDGSNLTGISGVTINSNADNRIITGSGTVLL